mmetsp:Transcript_50384/g.135656  ORF Transcript_50384/g.135656 Transcript_50384/m.135656 type:complete len:90 (+) Transcript_50384:100-369(+)
MMIRQALRVAARGATAVVPRTPVVPAPARARAFGAVTKHEGESAVARPFKGASYSEPEMEYVEEPSMLYMFCLQAFPWMISGWVFTKWC